jgi:hypothetical protein
VSPTHRQRAEELLGQVSVRSSDDALTAAGVNATLALCDAFNALAVVLAAQRSTPPTPQVSVAFAPGVASMDGA